MLLTIERDRDALQRFPPTRVTRNGTGRGFVLLAFDLSLRPQGGRDRVWVAIRHLGVVHAFQHRQPVAQPEPSLTDVVQLVSVGASDSIQTRRGQLAVRPARAERGRQGDQFRDCHDISIVDVAQIGFESSRSTSDAVDVPGKIGGE